MNTIFEPMIVAEIVRDLGDSPLRPAVARELDGQPIVIAPSPVGWDHIGKMYECVKTLRACGYDDSTIEDQILDSAWLSCQDLFTDERSLETWIAINQRLVWCMLSLPINA